MGSLRDKDQVIGIKWANQYGKFDSITNQPKAQTLVGLIIGQKISFNRLGKYVDNFFNPSRIY